MIFGEDFGQLAASGEYEVYKSGTTIAQLNAAIASLSDEEYLDSFLVINTDASPSDFIHRPMNNKIGNSRIYMVSIGTGANDVIYSQFWQGGVLYFRTKAITSGSMTITTKSTSGTGSTLLTITSWTLYRRQKGYDVANGGSNVAYAIAPVQDTLSAANKNYAVGEQFLYDGHLYKVTAAITSGAQIVIGTNAVAAGTVTEQIKNAVVVLKEAAANQTYAAQLAELEPYFLALSENDRLRACLVRSAQMYPYFGGSRLFSQCYIGSQSGTYYMFYEVFDIVNHQYLSYKGASAPTDMSSSVNTSSLKLMLY